MTDKDFPYMTEELLNVLGRLCDEKQIIVKKNDPADDEFGRKLMSLTFMKSPDGKPIALWGIDMETQTRLAFRITAEGILSYGVLKEMHEKHTKEEAEKREKDQRQEIQHERDYIQRRTHFIITSVLSVSTFILGILVEYLFKII